MASTIKIKNSSTAGAVPTSSDLVQGELAINVTDRRIFTENASGTVVELGTPSIDDNGNATAITIDSSENVGIGTSSPSRKLEVSSNDAQTDLIVSRTSNGLGTILRWDNTGGYSYLYNNGAYPLLFGTNSTERARIDSSGYFKASNTGTYEGGAYSEINGSGAYGLITVGRATSAGTAVAYLRATTSNAYSNLLQAVNGVTTTFQVLASGNVQNTNNSYGAISDAKLKENVTDATPKLDSLMQVRIVNYNLIGDANKQIGVVAQELEQVFPSMVDESPDYEEIISTDEDGKEIKESVATGTTTKSVKYSVFVPMLIKAIQEQQALITTLTERITALEQA